MEDKTLAQLRVPCFCPVCGGLMKGKSTCTFYDFGCCIDCKIQWVEGREARWLSGWRPSSEDVRRMKGA